GRRGAAAARGRHRGGLRRPRHATGLRRPDRRRDPGGVPGVARLLTGGSRDPMGDNPPMRFARLPPLSLYVHLPWCLRKCPYCAFNSYEARGALPEDAYVDALLRDLDAEMPFAQGRAARSVFLGGG